MSHPQILRQPPALLGLTALGLPAHPLLPRPAARTEVELPIAVQAMRVGMTGALMEAALALMKAVRALTAALPHPEGTTTIVTRGHPDRQVPFRSKATLQLRKPSAH